MRAAYILLALLAALPARAQFPVLSGDPVDPGTGRAIAALPGVPFILPDEDGRFRPPIVDTTRVGDVDIVVRAGHVGLGPVMPAPVATPPVAIAGGIHVTAGSEIPFTVIASDGSAGLGIPLGGTAMNGIPVLVVAFADLDGDGIVGPTSVDGNADLNLERQESDFLVGRQVAVFDDGIAQGTLAVWQGAPASAGGLRVVLCALTYVGPFSPGFFAGNLPDGPGLATLLPFFPRLDPDRVLDGDGAGGPATPTGRLGIELEDEFDPPVDDDELGTPFALPTDGSSGTIDRAIVQSGPLSRFRFVEPLGAVGEDTDAPLPIARGAGGTLWQPLASIDLGDDGPGGGRTVRLVPADVVDGITDPPAGTSVVLVAGPRLAITAPDADGDPTRETVVVASAAGVPITLDHAGAPGDPASAARLTVGHRGFPVAALAVGLGPGGSGPGGGPAIRGAALEGHPAALVRRCPRVRRLGATTSEGVVAVAATVTLDGQAVAALTLSPAAEPLPGLPAGKAFSIPFDVKLPRTGLLAIQLDGRTAAGEPATPLIVELPVVKDGAPAVADVVVTPAAVAVGGKPRVTVQARASDDCGLRRVVVQVRTARGFRTRGKLRDDGRKGDPVARDGVFTGSLRVRARRPGTVILRVMAKNRFRARGESPTVDLLIGP